LFVSVVWAQRNAGNKRKNKIAETLFRLSKIHSVWDPGRKWDWNY
jgi:hypothetical protein